MAGKCGSTVTLGQNWPQNSLRSKGDTPLRFNGDIGSCPQFNGDGRCGSTVTFLRSTVTGVTGKLIENQQLAPVIHKA
jgi:hypothetical protein